MHLENPNFLWLLLSLPLLALFFWWRERVKRQLLAKFIEARLLSQLTVGISLARRKWRFALIILAFALLIVAIAQPEHGYDLEEVEQNGMDVVVAIDTSKSMLTTDIAPDRLERAKLAALELMQRSGADRLGLIAFAGEAFLECPMTVDQMVFQQSVQQLDVNTIPEGGTSLASAINTALTAFKETGHHHALVLFTDGEDNVSESDVLAAAQNAAKAGLIIFTIGIGTAEGDLIRITDASGNSDYVRDENGNVVKSHLNEPLLKQIAKLTGGFYLPLRGADTMDVLYERGLAPLPKSELKEKLIRHYHQQFYWPLTISILLLVLEMLLPERKRESKAPVLKAGMAQTTVALLMLIAWSSFASAAPSDALRAYRSGNFTNALTEYEDLAEAHTNDLRFVFNAGTAAYRATNYDEAMNDFKTVTTAPDLKLQQLAFYNLGDTQYRQGELKFEPSSESLDNVETAWKQAVQSYTHAWQLNTNDPDAAYNLNFVQQQLVLIGELREAMRRAKEQADEAVRRNQYHHALEVLESLHNPIANKKFQDYLKKLKDIDAIVTPNPNQP
ncbi:MAG: VWA domain-containing protein [Verrucomicrobiota bacterium]|jgi:Ca-activated chloride channel family protein